MNDPYPTEEDLAAAVERFRTAGDREAARSAASDLARIAVDDAVVVSPLGADTLGAVRRLAEEGSRWLADAFAVQVYALEFADYWHRLRANVRTYRGEYDEQLGHERAVFTVLDGFDGFVRDLLLDDDPETRAVAAVLLSWISTARDEDRELLGELLAAEAEETVRDTLAEAVRRLAGPVFAVGAGSPRWPAQFV